MTKCKFFKLKDNFVGFECNGHTGYAEYGEDVLCATISGIVQSCQIGLMQVLEVEINLSRNDDSRYIKIELPKNLSNEKLSQSQILFKTVYQSIKDLMQGYSKYISMEVIEYDF